MADELPISYDKRELRSIITAFKAMDDEAVDAAKPKVLRWLNMQPTKLRPTASREPLDKPLSIALQVALKFPKPRRLASSLMDSRLSVSLVEDQLKTSGQVTNSARIVTGKL